MTELEAAALEFDSAGGVEPMDPDCCELCAATTRLKAAIEEYKTRSIPSNWPNYIGHIA